MAISEDLIKKGLFGDRKVQILDEKTGQVYDLGKVIIDGVTLESDSKPSYEPVSADVSINIKGAFLFMPWWNLEAYKAQVFKYDGNAEPVTIGDVWDTISRHNRRMIERQVKKGKNPDIVDYL